MSAAASSTPPVNRAGHTWTLRAPQEPGRYTIAAAFMYGTEKASPLGAVPQAAGGFMPRGGGAAPSGHMRFAAPVTITIN